jgi:hypothetical protein
LAQSPSHLSRRTQHNRGLETTTFTYFLKKISSPNKEKEGTNHCQRALCPSRIPDPQTVTAGAARWHHRPTAGSIHHLLTEQPKKKKKLSLSPETSFKEI